MVLCTYLRTYLRTYLHTQDIDSTHQHVPYVQWEIFAGENFCESIKIGNFAEKKFAFATEGKTHPYKMEV